MCVLTNQIYYVILRRCSGSPVVFVRKGGGYSSLVTADCLFTHNEAWSEMRQHSCDLSKYEVLFTRQVNGTTGIIGLSPDEILSAKKVVSLKPSRKQNQEIKEKVGNAKKKKTAPPDNLPGLFGDMGENRQIQRTEVGKTFDIF